MSAGLTLLALFFTVFPLAWFAYVLSVRLLNIHQSKVGLGRTIGESLRNQARDHRDLFFRPASGSSILLIGIHLALVITPFWQLDGALFFGWFLVLAVLAMRSVRSEDPQIRFLEDQRFVQVLAGTVLAIICCISVFSVQETWSLRDCVLLQADHWIHWMVFRTPVHLVFLILFQIAGMAIFFEHPFGSVFREKTSGHNLIDSPWVRSSCFFVWSILGASLFLGGHEPSEDRSLLVSFVLLWAKAGSLYILFRLVGVYFPSQSRTQTEKAFFVFLIPVALALLLLVLMVRGGLSQNV